MPDNPAVPETPVAPQPVQPPVQQPVAVPEPVVTVGHNGPSKTPFIVGAIALLALLVTGIILTKSGTQLNAPQTPQNQNKEPIKMETFDKANPHINMQNVAQYAQQQAAELKYGVDTDSVNASVLNAFLAGF